MQTGRLSLVVFALILLARTVAIAESPARFSAVEKWAVGDGKTDCTAAIQKALDAVGQAGGGIVENPRDLRSAPETRRLALSGLRKVQ